MVLDQTTGKPTAKRGDGGSGEPESQVGSDTAAAEPKPSAAPEERPPLSVALPADAEAVVRNEVNIELNFPPKLRGARSRLYRRRFLQVNTRWKPLAEIYIMHSFAPFATLVILF